MTVKELKAELEQYNEDCEVYVCDGHNFLPLNDSWLEDGDVVFM